MLMIALRFIHVLSAVMWTGFIIFMAAFLFPAMRVAGPSAGAVMDQLVRVRRVPTVMLTVAILTVLSGLSMFWLDSRGLNDWSRSAEGMTFGLGGLFGVVALIIGATVTAPAGKKAGALAAQLQSAGGPPSPDLVAEMQRLQMKVGKATQLVAVLVVVAAICMAVARYV